jgi:stalled ribosome rescue protein Dom34
MKNYFHALVWIDHIEAKIHRFNATESELVVVRSEAHEHHLHHKANSGDSGHLPVDRAFLGRVAQTLARSGAILITGPSSAKTELNSFIRERLPHLTGRIRAVETLDHPTDGQLLKHGRKYFHADDRMNAQLQA